jgi:hypothetical protein
VEICNKPLSFYNFANKSCFNKVSKTTQMRLKCFHIKTLQPNGYVWKMRRTTTKIMWIYKAPLYIIKHSLDDAALALAVFDAPLSGSIIINFITT